MPLESGFKANCMREICVSCHPGWVRIIIWVFVSLGACLRMSTPDFVWDSENHCLELSTLDHFGRITGPNGLHLHAFTIFCQQVSVWTPTWQPKKTTTLPTKSDYNRNNPNCIEPLGQTNFTPQPEHFFGATDMVESHPWKSNMKPTKADFGRWLYILMDMCH